MPQHDMSIANQTFPLTRADLNNALAALHSLQSGSTAPSTTAAGSLWYDTANGILKQRDAANAAWIDLWAVPTTTNEVKLAGGKLRVESTAPVFGLKDTDSGTNEKAWQVGVSGTELEISTRTDADASGLTVMKAARSGTTVSGLQLGGTGVWGAVGYFAAAGSSNAFTGTLSPAPAAYQTGLMIQFYANHSITGASTLNLNGLGAKDLKDKSGNALTSGQIASGDLVTAFYNGTEFRCLGISASASVSEGPAFRAYMQSGNQSIAGNTDVKAIYSGESFDTNTCYDNATNYRFTPNEAGYYQLNAACVMSTSAGGAQLQLRFFKNGSTLPSGTMVSAVTAGAYYPMTISDIVYFNGTTDYAEVYVRGDTGTHTLHGASAGWGQYFSGVKVRDA